MQTAEVIKILAERLNRPQDEVKKLGDAALKVFMEILDDDEQLTIPGFGTFGTREREPRKSFNPHHGKFVMLPKRRVMFFRPGKLLKHQVRERKTDI